MRLIGNILWVLLGGLVVALLWAVVGIVCCCTILAIPLGVQCFKFASLILWPFGRDVVFSNSNFSFLLNLLWILVFGWGLAAASLVFGLLWCLTIVGIPFGLQFMKFARLAFTPFGARIVPIPAAHP